MGVTVCVGSGQEGWQPFLHVVLHVLQGVVQVVASAGPPCPSGHTLGSSVAALQLPADSIGRGSGARGLGWWACSLPEEDLASSLPWRKRGLVTRLEYGPTDHRTED